MEAYLNTPKVVANMTDTVLVNGSSDPHDIEVFPQLAENISKSQRSSRQANRTSEGFLILTSPDSAKISASPQAVSSSPNPRTSSHPQQTQSEKVKAKMMSAWNNVRYGWTARPTSDNLAPHEPIYLLGMRYMFVQPKFYTEPLSTFDDTVAAVTDVIGLAGTMFSGNRKVVDTLATAVGVSASGMARHRSHMPSRNSSQSSSSPGRLDNLNIPSSHMQENGYSNGNCPSCQSEYGTSSDQNGRFSKEGMHVHYHDDEDDDTGSSRPSFCIGSADNGNSDPDMPESPQSNQEDEWEQQRNYPPLYRMSLDQKEQHIEKQQTEQQQTEQQQTEQQQTEQQQSEQQQTEQQQTEQQQTEQQKTEQQQTEQHQTEQKQTEQQQTEQQQTEQQQTEQQKTEQQQTEQQETEQQQTEQQQKRNHQQQLPQEYQRQHHQQPQQQHQQQQYSEKELLRFEKQRPGDEASFRHFFWSLLWMTYRRGFPALPGSRLTSDSGWGCMLRSGQMMLARALTLHVLGPDWRYGSRQTRGEDARHREVAKWFADSPSLHCPLSLHTLIRIAQKHERKAGDWFGPSTAAQILQEAVAQAPEYTPVLERVCVYVAPDCTLYKADVQELATSHRSALGEEDLLGSYSTSSPLQGSVSGSTSGELPWRSMVIIVPVRLGERVVNPAYIPCLKELFAQRWCIGIIGGRPKHSLYFVGYQGDSLLYLDPHFAQDAVNAGDRRFPLKSYHCRHPQKMSFSRMDPSCAVGFYCDTRADFEEFAAWAASPTASAGKANRSQTSAASAAYPLFVVDDGSRADSSVFSDGSGATNVAALNQYLRIATKVRDRTASTESVRADDYVFL